MLNFAVDIHTCPFAHGSMAVQSETLNPLLSVALSMRPHSFQP